MHNRISCEGIISWQKPLFNVGHTCMQGDLFGRCPTETDPKTGEASRDPEHWVSQHWHITLVIKSVTLVIGYFKILINIINDVVLVIIRYVATIPVPCRGTPPTMSLFPNLSDLLRNSLRQPNLLRWVAEYFQNNILLFLHLLYVSLLVCCKSKAGGSSTLYGRWIPKSFFALEDHRRKTHPTESRTNSTTSRWIPSNQWSTKRRCRKLYMYG